MDNNEPNIKVTEYHMVMQTNVGSINCARYFLSDDEKINITRAYELLAWLQEKVAIYGDPIVKELIFKDGEFIITGETNET